MPRLLHLDSSADPTASVSRDVTATFAATWRSLGRDHQVTYRDLHAERLPHLADAALHWAPRLRPPGSVVPAEAEALQQRLLDDLEAADVLLLGVPLYNYSLPSSLKAWLDHVHVLGTTASFDRPTQPYAGKPAVVVATRGATYDEGSPTDGWDHAVPVLELVLGRALGMTVTTIVASATLAGRAAALESLIPRAEAERAQAHARAVALAQELG